MAMTQERQEPETYRQFRIDMEAAGYEVSEYAGRFFYRGPAVATDRRDGPSLQDVMRATGITVQWDNLSLDFIVYPA